jgi:hypothetical protein
MVGMKGADWFIGCVTRVRIGESHEHKGNEDAIVFRINIPKINTYCLPNRVAANYQITPVRPSVR